MFVMGHPEDKTHVFAFAQTGHMIQLIEPSGDMVALRVLFDAEDAREYMDVEGLAHLHSDAGDTVIKHTFKPQVISCKNLILPLSCTSAVRIGTGVYSGAWTPYGLYKDLLKQGAEVIKRWV